MGEADGMLFQAMEMLEGADLGKVMAEGRHFTWDGLSSSWSRSPTDWNTRT